MNDIDCAIIGAGPAGLTSAIYLARMRRKVVVLDGGPSRAQLIPVSHNYPGFPAGVNGGDLVERLREQALSFGVEIQSTKALSLEKKDDQFQVNLSDGVIQAKKVLLATGIEDKHPPIEDWESNVCNGSIRLCPICDGYDARDHRIAVVSSADCAVAHAEFMRTYSTKITLYIFPPKEISEEGRATLASANVELINETIECIFVKDKKPHVRTRGGERDYDSLYVMLGEARSIDLAHQVGADFTADGRLKVDEHQATSVAGLFAAGDVVSSLHQISVATGQAAIAATKIHNTLPKNFCE